MEILEELEGGKVYLDTNIFIYAVEAAAEYVAAVEALFGLIEDGAVSVVTSELTLAESLAKPFEVGRHDIAQVYETMLTPSTWLLVLPIDPLDSDRGSQAAGPAQASTSGRHPYCDGHRGRVLHFALERSPASSTAEYQAVSPEVAKGRDPGRRPLLASWRQGVLRTGPIAWQTGFFLVALRKSHS
jgi:hypothetical protein